MSPFAIALLTGAFLAVVFFLILIPVIVKLLVPLIDWILLRWMKYRHKRRTGLEWPFENENENPT